MRLKKNVFGHKYAVLAAVFIIFNAVVVYFSLSMNSSYETVSHSIRTGFVSYFDKILDLPGVDERSWLGSTKRTARSLLRVVPKFLTGDFPAQIDSLRIDIKYKHLEKIKKERAVAIAKGILIDSNFYPAVLNFNGAEYAAKIRLKGDRSDHWSSGDRWSFRVKLKHGAAILGITQFSLQNPITRAIPNDFLFAAWMRGMGNIAPRHEFVRVTFNGDYWGVMNIEEHMSDNLLEMSSRKDGPIFKYPEEEGWAYADFNRNRNHDIRFFSGVFPNLFNDSKYISNPEYLALFDYGGRALRRLGNGEISVEAILDMDAFSKLFIATTTFGSSHAIIGANLRHYVNPYTLNIEPIATDQKPQGTSSLLVEDRMPFNKTFHAMLKSPIFYKNYSKNYKKSLLAVPVMEKEYKKLCRIFPLDCPTFNFKRFKMQLAALQGQEKNIRKAVRKKEPEIDARQVNKAAHSQIKEPKQSVSFIRQIHAEYHVSGRLTVWNLMSEDVFVEKVRLVCVNGTPCDDNFDVRVRTRITGSSDRFQLNKQEIMLPEGLMFTKDRFVEVTTRSNNQTMISRVVFAFPADDKNPFPESPYANEGLRNKTFINVADRDVSIRSGHWKITEPLVIPPGFRLLIDPGTTMEFSIGAYILSQGPIIALGTEEKPIHFMPSSDQKNWLGIYVSMAAEPSEFSHVQISKTKAFQAGLLNLTGGVSFYRSAVTLSHVNFVGSSAEDALNIVRSKFQISHSKFSDIYSDALDADFSQGEITETDFYKIGGDGIDLGTSEIKGHRLGFSHVFDKAVSVGEQSTARLSGIHVSDTGTAVVSKDGSFVTVDGLTVIRPLLSAGMSYVKKPQYGMATLKVSGTELGQGLYINQKGNSLIVNDEPVTAQDLDIDALYSSGRMKKIQVK